MTTRKKYVKGFSVCPTCGYGRDSQLRSIVEDNEAGTVRIQVNCENCLQEFEEVYRIVRQEWEVL